MDICFSTALQIILLGIEIDQMKKQLKAVSSNNDGESRFHSYTI